MAYTKLKPRFTAGASVQEFVDPESQQRTRLSIPPGPANRYRLAQLDDYAHLPRRDFPLRSPFQLRLSARVSSETLPGTWGFGLWNDPFGLSLGFGGNPLRLPTLPNAVWFFGASHESYLSFRAAPNDEGSSRGLAAANGFLAQTFRSPKFHPLLIPAGLALPFSRRMTRRLMGNVIAEDGIRLDLDVTQWHNYQLDWREAHVSFEVDNTQVFESRLSPHSPLGLVIWIDNQYAAFTPEGKIRFGALANPEPAWLDVKGVEVNRKG